MVKLLARPDQSLIVHHATVANGMLQILSDVCPRYPPLVDSLGPDAASKTLRTLVSTIAVCHDFGKASPMFQKMLNPDTKLTRKEKPLSYHVEPGALLCLVALPQVMPQTSENLARRLRGLAVCAILEHHSPTAHDLRAIWHDLLEGIENTHTILRLISSEVTNGSIGYDMIFPLLRPELDKSAAHLLNLDMDALYRLVDDLDKCIDEIEANNSVDDFVLYRFLYSSLCDMDEFDAGFHLGDTGTHTMNRDSPRGNIPENTVDRYRERLLQTGRWRQPSNDRERRVKQLREDTYAATLAALKASSGLVRLQAPTGSGKTLAMLSFAVKLREQKKRQSGVTPRIIYALPFISIAEQVEEITRSILNLKAGISDEMLTVHHSLSEPVWEEEISGQYDPRKSFFFTDRWRSDIIITTMVRLWDTVLGASKRDSARFNRIAESIILMDEVQSIPVKYWSLVADIIRTLNKELGCTVVLSTATMPAILEASEAYSVIINDQGINRYRLLFDPTPVTLDRFVGDVVDAMKGNPKADTLVVLNTKRSAAEAYSMIREHLGPDDQSFFMSGLVAPIHRSETIDRVKRALDSSKKRVVLVCTQVIEAGVDLSFDMVFRDMGPLDSIVQVAGRCNRSWEHENPGTVTIRLVVDRETPYSKYVYDHVDLEMARASLAAGAEGGFSEEQMRAICREYLGTVNTRKIHELGLDCARHLELAKLGSEFSLIDARIGRRQVFIDCDEQSHSMISWLEANLTKRGVTIPSRFYKYCVDLSNDEYSGLGKGVRNIADSNGRFLLGVVELGKHGELYSDETGLKTQ